MTERSEDEESHRVKSLNPKLHGIPVPVEADSVDEPTVIYGDRHVSINFLTGDERWGRVTFEKFDSIRISRGEYDPYPSEGEPGDTRYWVSVVEQSPWLRERYEYEKRNYGQAYEFGGDVDEMLHDFSHYIFSFHDEFVEVICSGIWFETADEYIGNRGWTANHPLLDLSPVDADRYEANGMACRIRRNPRPIADILKDAELCSQKLLQFTEETDGSSRVDWTVEVRVRNGRVRSSLKSHFGKVEETYDGVVALEVVWPRVMEAIDRRIAAEASTDSRWLGGRSRRTET